MCKKCNNKNFLEVNPKQSFPKMEEDIIKFWKENKVFEESIESRKNSDEFNFYDGPPFATGTPHYGHILGGVMKDLIPRYQTMKGKLVKRQFGWDCHGLPIENIVEKKMKISGKDDIEKRVGVYDFNESCRSNVFGFTDEWKKTVERMGRWVDIENSYKTMDKEFMESVWWVYKNLYDKGLIYEGHRVVPYCPRCSTPLSNFEVNQGYKDKQDKTASVKFKVKGSDNKYILAWTTTPWTLVANLGLAVGEDLDYAELLDKKTGETYILAKDRIEAYFKQPKETSLSGRPVSETEDYTIVREYKGKCLVGIKYEPVFDDFWTLNEANSMPLGMELGKNAYSVIKGHHVTTESGTGIVHIAPAYGEDDNIIGKEEKLGFVAHIADNGKTENLLENNQVQVFDYNEIALDKLKKENKTVLINTYDHSYPHCWRCDTPLIYRAISAWYVAVEKIRDKMVDNNQDINWVPEVIKNGRFGKWVENAKDWNISRNRYWGSAIPVWQSEDKSDEVCIGSIEELYELNKDFGDITKVIFVRHGRTDYNEKGLMDYQNKAKLNEDGKKQALEIAEIFKNDQIDAVYSSPLDRCLDTINPLAQEKNLEVNKIEDFMEINSPDLQDQNFSCKNYKWENGYGGGETIKEVYERVEKAFHKIIDENKGKTIVICSHGDPSFLARKSLYDDIDYESQKYTCGKYLENNPKRHDISAMYGIEYTYTKSKKAIDLHKHFVDDLFLVNETGFKAKNALGIHGWMSDGLEEGSTDFWPGLKDILGKNDINLEVPNFDKSKETSYKLWEEKLDSLDIKGKYDTIVAHSLGCPIIMEYILKNNIKLERLVLVAPSGLKGNKYLEKIITEIKEDKSKLKNLVNEIIVLHSKDDDAKSAIFEYGKSLAKKIEANFVEVDGYSHDFRGNGKNIIASLVKYGTPLKRVPEVLDCWFESGSMPYASKHYPFNTQENFKFPADFIAEGLDQTRGWFYTLLILGTALFDKAPMKNVIVNGIVLAEDGKKMSKSLKNYPDPQLIFDKYGADAMRFYLMNSPTVEAQDMRFSEAGVEEVVKKVILPLWNTYYFFTTYANIDNFQTEKGNIFYIRHGQTDNNKNGILNGGCDDLDLNDKGISDTHKLGKAIKASGQKFDVIISSPMTRTKHTANILKTYIDDDIEIIEDEAFREQRYGEFSGMSHKEIIEKYNCKTKADLSRIYRNNSEEDISKFENRVIKGYKNIEKKYKGKNILLVSHGGVFRAINSYLNNLSQNQAFYGVPGAKNSSLYKLPNYIKNNKLDKWIISELNKLIKEVDTGLENYKLNQAARPIVKFMDNLTNWYIRRSRKRFWKSENDNDKIEAYNTLYDVLIEVSKIISPFMPFISEHIYKNLTGKKSVHLELYPDYIPGWIFEDLNSDTKKTQDIITLGLAARANAKIRVRQPLSYIKIGEELEDYYKEIIKEELNIKEVKVFTKEEMPKKICKANGRLIGPKFGKDVKFIISEAKSGNFEELENGSVKVGDFTLESGDFEIVFESNSDSKNKNEIIESGFTTALAINTQISKDLKLEGYARDIVRHIQEARKEANYNVDDRIKIELKSENSELSKIIEKFGSYIQTETLSKIDKNLDNSDIKKDLEIENFKIKIYVQK